MSEIIFFFVLMSVGLGWCVGGVVGWWGMLDVYIGENGPHVWDIFLEINKC